MRSLRNWGALLLPLTSLFSLSSCSSADSTLALPKDPTPPQVFKNSNLLRTIDITKPYVRETIAMVIDNISKEPQAEYYVPIPKGIVENISYLEARGEDGPHVVNLAVFNPESETQYYRVLLNAPLLAGKSTRLWITLAQTDRLTPVPALIGQTEKQFLQWTGFQYAASAYVTEKQKTKIKFPNNEVPDYTVLKNGESDDPTKAGSWYTYGPYKTVKPDQKGGKAITLRFEYTSPVIKMTRMERHIEVSHWGGNIAFEERYWMTNLGAKLKDTFSRVQWASTNYYNPPTSAIKQLTFPLIPGAQDAYFTDEIGNVSTSHFRSNIREAHLELKPRYPVFGGWNYSFVVGWNHDLKNFLRVSQDGERYVLKIPFLEGPKDSVTYDEIEITIVLPEGATDVKYSPPITLVSQEEYLHYTFMDTLGRAAIKMKAVNVVDEQHKKELIVTYRYPTMALYRKPFVIFTGVLTLFTFSWLVSKIDLRIGK
ncbi:Ribophorin I [Choiromyces venosus 120613-1]|uniref:Dolichyl-diphosphooligosaccharide--protein glycosyltransferase subunit 1 n=1 Tax=Choiromyces venosus 120613-1 TaxID=1336337 RepID=A0A3N4K1D1_9PEZI|nr:Ribophorin I [Choiromyces venosus 120613-1]